MEKNINTSLAIQVLPKIQNEYAINIIDKVIEHIKSKGLKMVVCPFETVVEGEFNEIIDLLKETIILTKNEGIEDFMAYVKIAFNSKGVLTIDEKISKHNQ